MTVIKLGKDTYRVYSTAPIAMSFLFIVKNDKPVMKRYDVADDYFKYPEVAFDYTMLATQALVEHISKEIGFWHIQGMLMGSMA